MIESCILATDLQLHFKHKDDMNTLFLEMKQKLSQDTKGALDVNELYTKTFMMPDNKFLLQSAMMTAADLGAVTKPWTVHRHVSQLIAEEFWHQGDIERKELHLDPPPMLDRRASLSSVQLGFIDNVCSDLYNDMVALDVAFFPMLDGCMANRQKWEEIRQEDEDSR